MGVRRRWGVRCAGCGGGLMEVGRSFVDSPFLVSNESRHCPRCDALVPQRFPWSIVTPYFDKVIDCLTCPHCSMLFSREVWRIDGEGQVVRG